MSIVEKSADRMLNALLLLEGAMSIMLLIVSASYLL